jgi:uncharacterized protein
MVVMGRLFQMGRPASDVMEMIAVDDRRKDPYRPCPCGSGSKFRFCHGAAAPARA